jgi:DNA polymerase III subunit beta
MSVVVEQKALAKALAHFKGVVANRHIPVLDCVKLSAGKGSMSIEGTDLDMFMRLTIPAEGKLADLAVPYPRLERYVSALSGDISLKPGDKVVSVEAGRAKSAIPTMDVETFPPVDADDGLGKAIKLSDDDLKSIVTFCGSSVEGEGGHRAHLRGVCFDGDEASAVSTDGVQLSALPVAALAGIGRPIIPVAALAKASSVADGEIEIAVSVGAFIAKFAGGMLRSKLAAGEYPPWTRVIPSSASHIILVDAKAFDAALNRVLTGSGTNITGLGLAGNVLHLRAEDFKGGDATDAVECEVSKGSDVTFGLNSKMVRDAIAALSSLGEKSPNIEITLTDAGTAPAILRVPGHKAMRVVFPLRPRVLPEMAAAKESA